MRNFISHLKILKFPALVLLFLCVFVIAYYPFSLNIQNLVIISPPGRSFLLFWTWREWVSGFFIQLFLHAKPFSLMNLIYYGILRNGNMPETGTIMDIMAISYPLRQWLSLPFPLYWNIKFIIILLFNSLAGYFATKRITSREDAAILCGIFMAVNPFLVMMLLKARLREGILGFVILALYYLYELSKKPDNKTALKCGIFIGLSSIFYAFYGMFLMGIMAMVFVGKVVLSVLRKQKREIWGTFLRFCLASLVFIVIVLPWTIPYMNVRYEKGDLEVAGVTFFKDFPTPEQIFPKTPNNDSTHQDIGPVRLILAEELPLAWYFPIVFSVFGIFAFLKPRPLLFLMLFIFLFFYVLSLGPYLRIGNYHDLMGLYVDAKGEYLKLPYIFFYKYVPFISRMHHPDNYLSFASIALMIIVGLGITTIFNFLGKTKIGFATNLLLFICIAASLILGMKSYHPRAQFQSQICRVEVPEVYFRLSREPFCGVYELPIPIYDRIIHDVYDRYDFYQAFHHKKFIYSHFEGLTHDIDKYSGLPGMFPEDFRTLTNEKNSFHTYLVNAHKGAEPNYSNEDVKRVKALGYKYIILHELEFARYYEKIHPDRLNAERFQYYEKTFEHLKNSGEFELVEISKEYMYNFIPREKAMLDYDVAVFKIR